MNKIYYVEKESTTESKFKYVVKEFEEFKFYEEKLQELKTDEGKFVFEMHESFGNKASTKAKIISFYPFKFNNNEQIHEISFVLFKEIVLKYNSDLINGICEDEYRISLNLMPNNVEYALYKIFNFIFMEKQNSNNFQFTEKGEIIAL